MCMYRIDLAPGMKCLQYNLKNIQMVKSSSRLKSKVNTIFYQRAQKALTSVVSEIVIQEVLYTASHSYHVMYILL